MKRAADTAASIVFRVWALLLLAYVLVVLVTVCVLGLEELADLIL